MKVIGLTGGIGVGKSTVSSYLKEKGYHIIDADLIAHQLTEKGSKTLEELAEHFGNSIINDDGSLNRKKLGEITFKNPEEKKILENVVTSKVIQKSLEEIETFQAMNLDIVFLDAPLLFECGMDKYCQKVWTVTADIDTRIERVAKRDNLDRQLILDRISNQMDESEKIAKSDMVLSNDGSRECLYEQIEAMLRKVND